MPAANQNPLPALRISSTGVAQEDGGGGGDSDEPAAPQPIVHAPSPSSAMTTIVDVLDLFPLILERGRMPSPKQAKGQRKKGN